MIHFNTLLPSLSFSQEDLTHLGGTHLTVAFGTTLADMGAPGPWVTVRARHPDHTACTGACATARSQAGNAFPGRKAPHSQRVKMAELGICQQAASILGCLGKAPQEMGLE